MRRWETLQLVVVGVAVMAPVALGERFKKGRISVALLVSAAAQLVIEGFRWQLWPLHVTTLVMAITDWGWQGRKVVGWPRIRRLLFGVPSLFLLWLLPWALPVPEFPRPSGPFAIGTETFVLSDPERLEPYGLAEPAEGEEVEPTEPRRLVVQVWYPAVASETEPSVWHPDWDEVGPVLAGRLGFPWFFLQTASEVRGHAVEKAPPLEGQFPVIIYSHGWTGFRSIALDQIEMLASEGYMVIAPDHTYGAIATVFPDQGEMIEFDPRALPEKGTVEDFVYDDAAQRLVDTFSDDLSFILDRLDEGVLGELSAHADTELIGMFGHSAGGGAVVQTCLQDDRCKAVIGLDAWVEPVRDRVIAKPLLVPSMFMRSAGWIDTPNDARLRGIVERSEAPVTLVGVAGADHNDFVLTPLFSPVAHRLGLKGPVPEEVIVPFLHTYLDAFFDVHLGDLGGVTFDQTPPAGFTVEQFDRSS